MTFTLSPDFVIVISAGHLLLLAVAVLAVAWLVTQVWWCPRGVPGLSDDGGGRQVDVAAGAS